MKREETSSNSLWIICIYGFLMNTLKLTEVLSSRQSYISISSVCYTTNHRILLAAGAFLLIQSDTAIANNMFESCRYTRSDSQKFLLNGVN